MNCLKCGNRLVGRSDKKYCSAKCRNSFHNDQKDENKRLVRRVNYILNKNRQILRELNPEYVKPVKRDELVEKGFDFSFHTQVYELPEGNKYYYCYEYGYYSKGNGYLNLFKRKEKVI